MERLFQVLLLAAWSFLTLLTLRCSSRPAIPSIMAEGSVLVRRFVKASQLLGEPWHDLKYVSYDAEICYAEDGCLRILVYCNDHL